MALSVVHILKKNVIKDILILVPKNELINTI